MILGKPITLINTSNHQRWWLPNRDYWYEIRIIKGVAYHKVCHNESGAFLHEFHLRVDHPRYTEISLYAQKLAEEKYPRPKFNKKGEKEVTVFYNVVNTKDRERMLMSISSSHISVAQGEKNKLTIKYPNETYELVETEYLVSPYKMRKDSDK